MTPNYLKKMLPLLLDADPAAFRKSLLPARIRARLTQAQQLCEDIYVENGA